MFITNALFYSIFVSLRMIPIAGVLLYSGYLVLWLFQSEPLVIFMIVLAFYVPVLSFVYLNMLRCGLTAIKATGPPIARRYFPATIKIMRFNVMITNMLIGLIGVGGTSLVTIYLAPELTAAIREGMTLITLSEARQTLEVIEHLPLVVILFFALAITFGNAATGTTAAATANWVGTGSPNHDMIWGATRQWFSLLVLGMLVLLIPLTALVFALGGPLQPMARLIDLGGFGVSIVLAYILWATCVMAAGQSLTYVKTLAEENHRIEDEFDAMAGHKFNDNELRALRHERMGRSSLTKDN